MKGNLYTIVYAVCAGTFCALLLTAVSQFTRPYQEANQQADEMRNILSVLEVAFPAKTSAKDLVLLFDSHVRKEMLGDTPAYRLVGTQGAVALEFSGPGTWGTIRGFIALSDDFKTVHSITFHDHVETPGLGGEISTAAFRNQFRGKKLIADHGQIGIKVLREGGAQGLSEVDGISGATITGDRVTDMLRKLAEQIVEANPWES